MKFLFFLHNFTNEDSFLPRILATSARDVIIFIKLRSFTFSPKGRALWLPFGMSTLHLGPFLNEIRVARTQALRCGISR